MPSRSMTSKERILTAMQGGIPDTVPVQVGMYQMIPAKLTGLPFWDVFLYNKVELWRYSLELIKRFQFDGYIYWWPQAQPAPDDRRTWEHVIVRQDDDYIVQRTIMHTPHGNLWQEVTYPRDNTDTVTRGYVKDVHDFEVWLEHAFPSVTDFDLGNLATIQRELGDLGAVGASVALPGIHDLIHVFDGKLEGAAYFATDHPDLMEAYCEKREAGILCTLERILSARPDYVQIGASGLLTLSNPRWVRRYSLPTLKKITRLCREAGIPSELHVCGKERSIVQMCVEETELDSINPLQPPPMGDCDLAEVKRAFGGRITLKGNVGVTEPMLFGTPADVERDVIRCMEAAKAGGRFILFTEEQLGRDTPFENIQAMVDAARRYGKY